MITESNPYIKTFCKAAWNNNMSPKRGHQGNDHDDIEQLHLYDSTGNFNGCLRWAVNVNLTQFQIALHFHKYSF